MTADDRLKQALGLGPEAPPAVDIAFTARVLERVERRRLALRLATLAVWALAAGLLCWVLRPALADLGAVLAPASGLLALAAVVGAATWMVLRAGPGRVLRRVRAVAWPRRF
jgi:hypothetical protein